MQKITPLVFLVIVSLNAFSQKEGLKSKLYKLEERVIAGNIDALKQLAEHLDDTSFVQEYLGYHNYPNTARGVAKRIVEENCLFTDEEFKMDSSITGSNFLKILNNRKVEFDDITGMFLITPISQRNTQYILKRVTDFDLRILDTSIGKSSYPNWYYENSIDGFLALKNPEALKWIASAWFKKRARFNRYYFNDDEFIDFIKKLTHLELGVPEENGEITFLYKDDYYAKTRLNYLIYWTNHYTDYKWNDTEKYFENLKESGEEKGKEEVLFSKLNSEDDSVALDAYIQLTQLDTGKVIKLAKQYDENDIDNNYSLPTFLYRFIQKAVVFTHYCRDNGIKFNAEGWLKDSLARINHDLLHKERYRLENYIIANLSLADVTCVEYFGLIYEQEWGTTYSVGRIIDKFYSRKFQELISDTKQLEAFLKKSKLFNEIGIIGIFNKYLRKFENCSKQVLEKIKTISVSTKDTDVKRQAEKIINTYANTIKLVLPDNKRWAGSNDVYGVRNLKDEYRSIIKSKAKRDDKENELKKLFGEISYNQISEALEILITDTILNGSYKFSFLENDFGFQIITEDVSLLNEFIQNHKIKSEYQMCELYLKGTGLDYTDENGKLNYDKIREILKYDVVDAFSGGGGGRRETGVYLIIKMLELKFNTTLGFPKKLCSWQGMYSCSCDDRAKAWLQFLIEKYLVVVDKEPPSISYNN